MKAPSGLQTVTADKKFNKLLINKTLLVDGTQSTDKSLVMVREECFEIFQLSISISLLEYYLEEYMQGFTDEIRNFCYQKSTNRSQIGVILPIESKEELCFREIINCPFGIKLQSQYTKLKVTELIIYYFQRMVNGGVLEEVNKDKLPLSEREIMVEVKTYLEENNTKEVNYSELCRISKMKQDKLNKMFHSVFGYSIAKYHRTVKLQNAYNHLLDVEKNLNVNEVAFESGFASVASFSRAFYNEFKIRPSELKLGNIQVSQKPLL